jgi:type IV pilus assembly protein PilO
MDFQELTEKINSFDVNDIDWNNMGSWPLVGRAIFAVVVFIGIVVGLYFVDIQGLSEEFDGIVKNEATLKKSFETKAFQVANLDAYKNQLAEIEESFGSLLRQLPRDTEVPGLLEDITAAAVAASLEIKSIALKAEVETEYYTELPIDIDVVGDYHDFGVFVSAVAGLGRIVTLHDFEVKGDQNGRLSLQITAKTYRYSTENGTKKKNKKKNAKKKQK